MNVLRVPVHAFSNAEASMPPFFCLCADQNRARTVTVERVLSFVAVCCRKESVGFHTQVHLVTQINCGRDAHGLTISSNKIGSSVNVVHAPCMLRVLGHIMCMCALLPFLVKSRCKCIAMCRSAPCQQSGDRL